MTEYESIIERCLSDCSSIRSKKILMTKEVKGLEEHLASLKNAYDNKGDKNYGLYLGNKIFFWHVDVAAKELEDAKRIRRQLDQ